MDINSKKSDITEDLISKLSPGRRARGGVTIYEKPGDYEQAIPYFKEAPLKNVKDIFIGKEGPQANQASLKEKWVRWEPIKNLSPKYFVTSIIDNLDGFTVLLSDTNDGGKRVKITGPAVACYRKTNQKLMQKTLQDLSKVSGEDFYTKWTFFRVENSRYISWLYEQSGELIMSRNPIHFSLLGVNLIVDIVVSQEPKVEFIAE